MSSWISSLRALQSVEPPHCYVLWKLTMKQVFHIRNNAHSTWWKMMTRLELPYSTPYSNASSALVQKRGIKCPFSFTTAKSLTDCKSGFLPQRLIYGLRHPVKAFESYYNYRVSILLSGKSTRTRFLQRKRWSVPKSGHECRLVLYNLNEC